MIQSAVAGLVSGGAYAALGVCLVVMYRVVGVVNFAQAAIGAFGAFVAFAVGEHGWAYGPALAAGMMAGAGVGVVCGAVMATWFAEASAEVRSTVSIALLVTIVALGLRVFGDSPRTVPELLPGVTVRIAGVNVTMAGLAALIGATVLALAIGAFLRWTRTGLMLRALAERPTAAELLGVPVRRVVVGIWAGAGAVSAAAVVVIAPSRSGDFLTISLLVVPALASALVGALRGLGAAVVAGVMTGLLEGLAAYRESIAPYRQALPFFVIVVVLLWSERHEVWDAAR